MDLNLSIKHHGDRATIHAGGEVDLATSPQLQAVLVELVDRGFHQLIIDLEQVSFLDCTGIGVLVDARRRVQEHGGSLRLVGPKPPVRRVLALTGMTAVFSIDTSPGEALATQPVGPQDAIMTRPDPSAEPTRDCTPEPGSAWSTSDPRSAPMRIHPADLVVSVATLCRLGFDRGLAHTMQQVVDAAKKLLGADGVVLMLADSNGQLHRASSSNQRARDIEEHQDRAAVGLCAAAFAKRVPMSVRDVHLDLDSHGSRVVLDDAQIMPALSVPVELDGEPIGALGVYSATPRAWDDTEVSAVEAYAGVVASLLAASVAAHVQGRLAAQLQTALDRRTLIEQAKGMLMAKEGVDAAAAFERLRTAARSTRRPVVDVAYDLIAGRPLPQPRPPRHADRVRRDRVTQASASME